MKTILLAMTALTALAAAAPAAAQAPAQAGVGIEARIDELDARLEAGIRQGSISRAEAQAIRPDLRALTRLERQYGRDGLTRVERQDLRQRSVALRERIRIAERSGGYARDGRDCPPGLERRDNGCIPPGQEGRDGRWEDRRDGRDGRWEDRRDGRYESSGRIDSNRDGYDDRDLNRDGRIDSDDDRYQDRDRRGGVAGGLIDRLGGGSALRVGQRASADLGAVPYAHRDHYRDGNGVYYRADRRNIYRIDARTDLVLQVYALNR